MAIWDGTVVPTKPWSDIKEAEWGWDFVACLEYNPPDGFTPDDIATVRMLREGVHDEGSWEWEATLRDGRVVTIEGWCDYTGWDCRSGATYLVNVSSSSPESPTTLED